MHVAPANLKRTFGLRKIHIDLSNANISGLTGERKHNKKHQQKVDNRRDNSSSYLWAEHTLGLKHKQTLNSPFHSATVIFKSGEWITQRIVGKEIPKIKDLIFDHIFTGVNVLLGRRNTWWALQIKLTRTRNQTRQIETWLKWNSDCLVLILNKIKAVDDCLWYRLAESQYLKKGSLFTLLRGHSD